MLNKGFQKIAIYLIAACFLGYHLIVIDANDDDHTDWATSTESKLGLEALTSDEEEQGSEQHQDHHLSESITPGSSSKPSTEIPSQNRDSNEQDKTQQRKFVLDMMADLPRKDPFYEYCTGEPDPGICTGSFTRYAFSINQGECVPFEWGGCSGNLNNYELQGTCMDVCLYAAQKRALTYSAKYNAIVHNSAPPVKITKLQATTNHVVIQPITI